MSDPCARRLFFGLALLLCAAVLWPLEVTQGRLKLTLHEGIGRFSLSYLMDPKGTAYKPLLVANDPRTSSLSLSVGNRVFRLGDDRELREKVEKTKDGARFVWTSPSLVVTEEFSFISSPGAATPDGVLITLAVRNVSDQELSIGVRYLFDTYLGEPSYVHFRTDKLAEMSRELVFAKADRPRHWVSPMVGDPEDLGLMCMLTGPGITAPDKIVFANWKRLSDASWGLETSPSRTFSLMPYSVNDSAVCHYFDPRAVPKGFELRLATVLGRYTRAGFSLPAELAAAPEVSTPQPPAFTGAATREAIQAARAEMAALEELISRVDKKLSTGQEASDEELSQMDAAIAGLKERSGRYTKSAGK